MFMDAMGGLFGPLRAMLVHRLGLWKRYERSMDGLFRLRLQEHPGTFLDVGVHLGQTLLKVKSLSPSTPYVGFEPNPICVNLARQAARRAGLSDTRIIPVGLARETGILPLLARGGDTDSAASTVAGFRNDEFYSNK